MEKCDKREAIMQAALELVADHGFHGAPIALVAERAGVAAGTIYRYFDNKDVLILETYAAVEERLLEALMTDLPDGDSVRERYLHICRTLVLYFLASPMDFRFLGQFYDSPYGVDRRRDKLFGKKDKGIVIEVFEAGLRQQVIKDLPLPILCALTFGPLVDACRDHIFEFIHLDEQLIEQTVGACWDAVRR